MGIESWIINPYIQLFGVSLFIVGFSIIGFLERCKKKVGEYENSITNELNRNYLEEKVNVKDVVNIYNTLVKKDDKINQVKANITGNLWGGILFLISCLLGFALREMKINETISIIFISFSGFFFVYSFISLIYWYVKN